MMKQYLFASLEKSLFAAVAAVGIVSVMPVASAQTQMPVAQTQMPVGQAPMAADYLGHSPVLSPLTTITARGGESHKTPVTPAQPRMEKPVVKGPFETYVQTVTGRGLRVFGQNLFNDVPSTFSSFDDAPVNADYVIGTGDELQIRGWGMVDIEVNATVDRSGAINIPRVGTVRVAGIKYGDLQPYLKQAVAKLYNNFDLTVSVSQARAVQVYVVGHAQRPGTYTLSAMSTLLNALFTSGGPTAAGSMRNIQVKRGGAVVTTFDLYDMLINGDKTRDVTLRDGDVIYIPEVGPLMALTGNVKQPAIFELKGPTTLADVVKWAGNFDSSSTGKQIVVEKNVDNNYKAVAEIAANTESVGALAGIPVKSADIVRVFAPGAIPVQVQMQSEYVVVAGEVRQSGVFRISKGETLRQLISRLGGPTENGYIYATRLQRESVKVSQQTKLNEVADRFENDIERTASARIAQTSDQANLGIIAADVERQRRLAEKLRNIKAEGRIVLEMEASNASVKDLPDLPLRDGDNIFVPRKPATVEVAGAVFQPNSMIYKPRRTVNDYVALAGGPTDSADNSGMYVIRADGTAKSARSLGWLGGLGRNDVNPGDTIVMPENLDRGSWVQSFKEWTTILYQLGLGAAGLKVLRN